MVITALSQKGNNVIISLDDGEFITLDYRTVIDYGLRKNDIIDENKRERLISESNFLKAKDSAFRFLGRRHHSISELKTKLIKKKYSSDIIEKVISDLTSRNFLDDVQFAESYVEERAIKKKVGVNKLKSELYKKGIDRNITEKILAGVNQETSYENAYQLALKKNESLLKRGQDSRKRKSKIFGFLSSRGYEPDVIIKVLNNIVKAEDE